jgi:hypothetical protein
MIHTVGCLDVHRRFYCRSTVSTVVLHGTVANAGRFVSVTDKQIPHKKTSATGDNKKDE